MDSVDRSSALHLTPNPATASKRLLPWLVAVAFFMESLDTTILNTAVPAISAALHVRSAEHEVGAGQLHAEPGGLHSHQRLDGGPVRNPPRVCLRHRPLHAGVISLRHIEQHSSAGRLPHSAGLRRSHDGAGRPAHPGAHLCQIRTDPRHELCRHSRVGWPHAGTRRGRSYRRLLSLALHLLREYTHRPAWSADGLPASAGLSRRENSIRSISSA